MAALCLGPVRRYKGMILSLTEMDDCNASLLGLPEKNISRPLENPPARLTKTRKPAHYTNFKKEYSSTTNGNLLPSVDRTVFCCTCVGGVGGSLIRGMTIMKINRLNLNIDFEIDTLPKVNERKQKMGKLSYRASALLFQNYVC